MSTFARMMFAVAKSQVAGVLVRNCFAHWSHLLPLQRVQENADVIAFYHPKPTYNQHLVIIPKKQIPNLLVLGKHPQYAAALFTTAQKIVVDLHWEPGNYVFCSNGGPRQEVQQVHFHLYAGSSPLLSSTQTQTELVYQSETMKALRSAQSQHTLQLQLLALEKPEPEEPLRHFASDISIFYSFSKACQRSISSIV